MPLRKLIRGRILSLNAEELRAVFGRGLADNSLLAYAGAWERLIGWLDGRELSDGLLAEYLDGLNAAGQAVTAGDLTLAAVRRAYQQRGRETPAGAASKGALKEWRRANAGRGRGQAAGVRWEWAGLAAELAERDGGVRGARDAALVSVMSDALLRGGEAAALRWADFDLDGTMAAVIVQQSKGAEEPSAPLYLGRETAARLRSWFAQGRIAGGPAFRQIDKGGNVLIGGLSRVSISRIVAQWAKAAGVSGRVSSHSLRIGMAGSLASRGAGVVEMQQAGRWKSPRMPAHYAGKELAGRGAVARLIYQQ